MLLKLFLCHPSNRTNSLNRARHPPLYPLCETLDLPSSDFGPVDFPHGFHCRSISFKRFLSQTDTKRGHLSNRVPSHLSVNLFSHQGTNFHITKECHDRICPGFISPFDCLHCRAAPGCSRSVRIPCQFQEQLNSPAILPVTPRCHAALSRPPRLSACRGNPSIPTS